MTMEKYEEDVKFLKEKIAAYPDFPKPGILFRDFFSLLRDPESLVKMVDIFVDYIGTLKADAIVGLEARGFLLGSVIAYKLRIPFVPVRKKGKLPGKKLSFKYELEYGQDEFEIQEEALKVGQRVVIVDDVIATGGSVNAAIALIKLANAVPIECVLLIELAELNSKDKVPIKSTSFLKF